MTCESSGSAHAQVPSGVIQGERCHDLKVWPEPWANVVSGRKPFEVRRDDRDYQRDDMLLLREWDPEKSEYTGWAAMVRVTWVTRGEPPSPLPEGVVVLGLELLGRSFQFIEPVQKEAVGGDPDASA